MISMARMQILLVLILTLILNSAALDSDSKFRTREIKLICVDSGVCMTCSKDEMFLEYCKETGRKMRTTCSDRNGGKEVDDYRACAATAEDDQLRVIVFQVMMAVLGSLAFFVVQGRKHMTMYDTRKSSSNTRRQSGGNGTW